MRSHLLMAVSVAATLFAGRAASEGGGLFGVNRHEVNGIEIRVYLGIIACLLIALWRGRKPTLRTYEMICLNFCE